MHAPSLNATASILRTSARHGGGSRPCLAGVSSCHASVESRERWTRTWAGNHPTQYQRFRRRAIIDFDASGRLASRDAAQIVPQPHPTSWPSCPVEIAALAAPYLLPRSSWSSRQPPNANECPRRAPRGQTRAHGPQSICRHRGNREAHRRRARTARESNCAAPALDQPSAAVASRGGPADCACADSRGCLTRDGCAIHRHANLDAHLLLRAAEPKNR